MWVGAFYLPGAIGENTLKAIGKTIVVVAIGLYLQVLLSLGATMIAQFNDGAQQGYWYVKSLVMLDGSLTGFWMSPSIRKLQCLRP
ncbi:MAG: hypothetical protein GSR83_03995 [Desulfurococcales archaeon]|nr:hypothetical protein [Desulfurococcales archaeon]